MVLDCDQHLYEPRTLWQDYSDPRARQDALAIEDDDLGYAWLTWRGRRLELADVQVPGDTTRLGSHRERRRAGQPAVYRYDEALPEDYWHPSARVRRLDDMRLDAAVLFPNFGLLWERALSDHLDALRTNMTAWNRWCVEVAAAGEGRLHPVAHLTLRDAEWVEEQLRKLRDGGVRLAMIAAAPVDGKPLSHRDHDRIWAAFVEHGVTPTFHVGEHPRAFADGWYAEPEDNFVSPLDSIMLSAPPAIAVTDLIVNGTFARHPDLRLGIIELGASWVPHYLLMLDGGWEFTARINGCRPAPLDGPPSDCFRRHVRVAAFSYEHPQRLAQQCADVFMACSDYPHAEGTPSPLDDYAATGVRVPDQRDLFEGNAAFLLGAAAAPVAAPSAGADTGWLATQR